MKLQPDDNQVFLTGSVDRTIRLWDLRTDACQQTFWGHEADVNSLAFHPNGQNFVTCSEDKTSRLWDIRSDQEVTSQSWHLQFSRQKGTILLKCIGPYINFPRYTSKINIFLFLTNFHKGDHLQTANTKLKFHLHWCLQFWPTALLRQ